MFCPGSSRDGFSNIENAEELFSRRCALSDGSHTHDSGSVYFELVTIFLEELNCTGFECISQLSLAQRIAHAVPKPFL